MCGKVTKKKERLEIWLEDIQSLECHTGDLVYYLVGNKEPLKIFLKEILYYIKDTLFGV